MRDLRTRLGVILTLALLPLLAFSIWRSYTDYNSDQALLRSNTNLTARIALSEIDSSFETTQSILRFTSTLLGRDTCRADLRRLIEEYPRFHNIIHADGDGNVNCSAKTVRSNSQQAARLLGKLSEEDPLASVIFNLPSSGGDPKQVIATAHGIYEDGQLSSVFVAVEDMNFLLGLLQKSKILDNSELAIFNNRGELLGGEWRGDNLGAITQELPQKQLEAMLNTQDANTRPILILPTPVNDIYLAIASERNNIITWNKFIPLTYAAIPLLAWLFGFAAIWLSTDQLILSHIRRMRGATLDFARGNRTARVGDLNNPPASIHALAQNFDIMADRIVEREATIGDSLDEKETLLREIHHRVKNNLQIIISLLNMQERKLSDKASLVAIVDTRSRINAIALVHRGLYESQDLRFVDMQAFLNRLLPELSLALGLKRNGIVVNTRADCDPMEADTATPVALFIVEALTNAVKHGVNTGGEIDITILQTDKAVKVSVSDTGKNTDSDKTASEGAGTKLMKGFARQLGGHLDVNARQDGFEIALNFLLRDAKTPRSVST